MTPETHIVPLATQAQPFLSPAPVSQQPPPGSRPGVPGYYSGTPWLWADMDPATDVLRDMGLENVEMGVDLDSEMSWQHWLESVRELGSEMGGGQSRDFRPR